MTSEPRPQPLESSPRFAVERPRRDFLGLAALASFLGTGVVMVLGALRLPMPSVFPESGSKFRIGGPERYPAGSATHLADRNVLVLRDQRGFRALSLVCPHLGCIAQEGADGFVCPCHGSRFDAGGAVVQGPAPSGLRYLDVSRAPSGDLVVDLAKPVPADRRLEV